MARRRFFVAAWDQSNAIVVFSDHTPQHARMLAEVDIRPPSDGLFMYEVEIDGRGRWTRGTWRRPTDAEAIAAAAGENPCHLPCGVDGSEVG